MKRTMEEFAKKADEIEKRSNNPYTNTKPKSSLRPRSSFDPVKSYVQSLQKEHNV